MVLFTFNSVYVDVVMISQVAVADTFISKSRFFNPVCANFKSNICDIYCQPYIYGLNQH